MHAWRKEGSSEDSWYNSSLKTKHTNKPWFIAFANFPGITTQIVADFKAHRQSWEEMRIIGSRVRSGLHTALGATMERLDNRSVMQGLELGRWREERSLRR